MSSPKDQTIARAAIYPSIGIARVGNSASAFFIGPEVEHPKPESPGFYHDETGALKRQAARFRVYGFNEAGEVVRELTAEEADIEWTVQVANKKASWYEFQLALDIPEAASAPTTSLRNAAEQDRSKLEIHGGTRCISGCDQSGSQYYFDAGAFYGKEVYLGELRTDYAGRLLFLGGHGVSASYDGSKLTTFANNDKWSDDTSDGPVTAKVTYEGRSLPVDPAWVVTAPPNYGPDLQSVRTLHDLLYDLSVQSTDIPKPEQANFYRDIYPLLQRLNGLQWVNYGFSPTFGWNAPWSVDDEALVKRLSEPGDVYAELRRDVANNFRNFERDGYSPVPWPWIYGDAISIPPAKTPRQYSQITETQLHLLNLWADGKFVTGDPSTPNALDDVPVHEQPDALNRGALGHCLADAFHPGCEVTWPIRHRSMFMSPYRIRHATQKLPDNYGPVLTPAVALSPAGPLNAQEAGDLTRWMAVPWQADTASCRSNYTSRSWPKSFTPNLPTFWPARVPNQVLTFEQYEAALNPDLCPEERVQAFNSRASWFRRIDRDSKNYVDWINRMVTDFGEMGVVELRPGTSDLPDLPPLMRVESKAHKAEADGQTSEVKTLVALAPGDETPIEEIAKEFGVEASEIGLVHDEKMNRFPHGLK